MKLILFLSLMWVVTGLGSKSASADAAKTRQVVGGDVLYTATATARSESGALNQAESRAVHDLSVECSIPPREARVYQQSVSRLEGQFEASVQLGVSIEDCEAARKAPPERKLSLTNTALLREENVQVQPARPISVAYHFTQAQLASHERAIDQRISGREAERRKLKASFRY